MNNKIIGSASRTVLNVFVLGLIAAGTIFTVSLLNESGKKMVSTLVDDVKSIAETDKRAA